MTRLLAVIFTLVALAGSGLAQSYKVIDREFTWKSLQTEHFTINYYGTQAEARTVAAIAEEAYQKLTTALGITPRRAQTPIFLYRNHNDFEQTNILPRVIGEGVGGFSEPLQDRLVIPYLISTRDLRRLIFHELVHIICFAHLYPQTMPSYWLLKNVIYPDWMMEGVAEFFAGNFDSVPQIITRDAAYHGLMRPLAELQSFSYLNPHEAYLMYKQSYLILEYMSELDPESPARLVQYYQDRFSPNAVIGELFGVSSRYFSQQFLARMQRQAQAFKGTKQLPEEVGEKVTTASSYYYYYESAPLELPGGELLYLTDIKGYQDTALLPALGTGPPSYPLKQFIGHQFEYIVGGSHPFAMQPATQTISFIAEWKNDLRLYHYSFRTSKLTSYPLPELDTAGSPQYTATGQLIVYGTRGSTNGIYLLSITGTLEQTLYQDKLKIDSPALSPSGELIAFTREEGLQDDLVLLDLATKSTKRLMATPGNEAAPTFSSDGKQLFFTSDQGSVSNLYCYNFATGKTTRLSNIFTGLFHPQASRIHPNRLYVKGYSHGRFQLYKLDLAKLPQLDPGPEYNNNTQPPGIAMVTPPELGQEVEFQNRLTADYLFPLLWLNQAAASDSLGSHRLEGSANFAFGSVKEEGQEDRAILLPDLTLRYINTKAYYDLIVSLRAYTTLDKVELTGPIQKDYLFDRVLQSGLFGGHNLDEYTRVVGGVFSEQHELDWLSPPGPEDTRTQESYLLLSLTQQHLRFRSYAPYDGALTKWTVSGNGPGWPSDRIFQSADLLRVQAYPHTLEQSTSLRINFSHSQGPKKELYGLGWDEMMRGYPTDELTGPTRLLTNLEYRFPIKRDLNWNFLPISLLMIKDIYGSAFTDNALIDNQAETLFRNSVGISAQLICFAFQRVPFSLNIELGQRTDISAPPLISLRGGFDF